MYKEIKVEIPELGNGVSRKKIKGTTYIYYTYAREYNKEKKYTVPKDTSIGKCAEDDPGMMYPNDSFYEYFPESELLEEKEQTNRSSCLRVGTYLVLKRIIADYKLDEKLGRIIGKDSGLFLDLVNYSIIAENNAGQYYPDYAFT